ncbi:MAG: hypothetical protein WB714_05845, partial [Candidatus Sulfotelmatobacter sp.]
NNFRHFESSRTKPYLSGTTLSHPICEIVFASTLSGQFGPQKTIHGPKEFAAFADKIRDAFPDMEIQVQDAFGIGDRGSPCDGQRR